MCSKIIRSDSIAKLFTAWTSMSKGLGFKSQLKNVCISTLLPFHIKYYKMGLKFFFLNLTQW